jgi:hypothetical protein
MDITSVAPASRLLDASNPRPQDVCSMRGHLVEVEACPGGATTTLSAAVVFEAQQSGRCAAWVTTRADLPLAEDLAAWGIDLRALLFVRAPDARAAGRAAERLLRTGAWAAVVLEPGAFVFEPARVGRLSRLAASHHATVLVRREGRAGPGSSLVGMRVQAIRERPAGARPRFTVNVLRHRRGGAGAQWTTTCDGPPGLR